MCTLKMLFRQQVIHNLYCPLVVECLVYSALISLVGIYYDGHLMELISLSFCVK